MTTAAQVIARVFGEPCLAGDSERINRALEANGYRIVDVEPERLIAEEEAIARPSPLPPPPPTMTTAEVLGEIRERLGRSQVALSKLAADSSYQPEKYRLSGKVDGIAIALDYLREYEAAVLARHPREEAMSTNIERAAEE